MKMLFQNLGTSEKEMRAFLILLELGAQPASVVAKHMDIPRSSMYVLLDRLQKLNLVATFQRAGMTYFQCVPVKHLEDLLKTKARAIDQTLRILQEKLPELQALESKLSITPTVKFFEGKRAVMHMYEEVLKEREFYALFNPLVVKSVMPEYSYTIAERLQEARGKAKEMLVDSPEAKRYQKRFESEHHQIRLLPKGMIFSADTIITQNNMYMVAYGEEQISGTQIQNTVLAQTHRVIFEQLWRTIQKNHTKRNEF